jgi:hypothetical protein
LVVLRGKIAAPKRGHREVGCGRDVDLGAEAVERQALEQIGRARRGAVDEKALIALGDEKLEQDLALGGQQRGIDAAAGPAILHVIADETLQKGACFRTADCDERAVIENGRVNHRSSS